MSDTTPAELNPPTPEGSATDAATTARRSRHRRRHRRKWLTRLRSGLWPVAVALLLLLIVVGIWGGTRAYAGWRAYGASRADIDRLQAQASLDPGQVSTTDLAQMQVTFQDLSFDLDRLDRVMTTTGAAPILGHLPWVAPRYHAAQQLLTIGQLLAGAGDSGSAIAQQTLDAFQRTGVMATDTAPTSPTWLDVVSQHDAEIQQISQQVKQAQTLRASLNTALLPGRVRAKLPVLDKWLNKYDVQQFASADLPALQSALGSEHDVRYLVLFQNPEELRPAGGFPGTIALVTLRHGQVTSYTFSDIHTLTDDYMAQRASKLAQPWPIQQYFPQDGFLIQDATWYADFAKSGATVMQMYAETDWPPIDGVIAVEPAAVSDVLQVIGPVTVDVDGQTRTITANNVLDEVERQRRLREEGLPAQLKHKQVLELIGEQIISQIKQGDRSELVKIARNLEGAAKVRDVQAYSPDAHVEGMLDARAWSGRLAPQPDVPTLAVTFANLVLVKDSLRMEPALNLQLGDVQNGMRQATLTITLKNTGTNAEDPFYAGFQKWWVQVGLPQGSRLTSSDPASLPDPEAPNGGSYKIDLFPQQTGKIVVTFAMPESDTLLVRRQPGVSTVTFTASSGSCQKPATLKMNGDSAVSLDALCK